MTQFTHADDTTFDLEVLQASVPVVDFWCGRCRMVAPELEALAAEHGDALKVDASARTGSALRHLGHPDDRALPPRPARRVLSRSQATATGTGVSVVDPHELMTGPEFASLASQAAAQLPAALAPLGSPVLESVS